MSTPSTLKGSTGALDHVALSVTGREGMIERCRRSNVSFFERTVPTLGLHQVFIKDPDGSHHRTQFSSIRGAAGTGHRNGGRRLS